MFRGWEPFAALVSGFGRDENEKAMQWFDAFSADDLVAFSRNLGTLATLRADRRGNEMTLFDTLAEKTKSALVTIVSRGWKRFPSQVLLSLQGVEALQSRELMDLVGAERERKRRRLDSPAVMEEDKEAAMGQFHDPWQAIDDADRAMEEIEEVDDDDEDDDDDEIDAEEVDDPVIEDDSDIPSPPSSPQDQSVLISLHDALIRAAARASSGASQAVATQQGAFAFSLEQIQFLNSSHIQRARLGVTLAHVSEEAVAVFFEACGSGIDAPIGSRALTALISELLLPRVLQLTRPASRILLSCAQTCIEADARAAINGLLVPVLASRASESYPTELITQCLEQQLDDADATVFLRAFSAYSAVEPWTEPMFNVLQRLISSALLTSADIHSMLVLLTSQVSLFHGNLKFAKLLQTLITKHTSSLDAVTLELAKSIAVQLTSFLKKPIEAKLKRITV